MEQQHVFAKVVGILTPFVKSKEELGRVAMGTSLLDDLKLNSARLVDVVIAMEDTFGIEVKDEEADSVKTVGDAVTLILGKTR